MPFALRGVLYLLQQRGWKRVELPPRLCLRSYKQHYLHQFPTSRWACLFYAGAAGNADTECKRARDRATLVAIEACCEQYIVACVDWRLGENKDIQLLLPEMKRSFRLIRRFGNEGKKDAADPTAATTTIAATTDTADTADTADTTASTSTRNSDRIWAYDLYKRNFVPHDKTAFLRPSPHSRGMDSHFAPLKV